MPSNGSLRDSRSRRYSGSRSEAVILYHLENDLINVERPVRHGSLVLKDGDEGFKNIAFDEGRLGSSVCPGILEEIPRSASERIGAADIGEKLRDNGVFRQRVELLWS